MLHNDRHPNYSPPSQIVRDSFPRPFVYLETFFSFPRVYKSFLPITRKTTPQTQRSLPFDLFPPILFFPEPFDMEYRTQVTGSPVPCRPSPCRSIVFPASDEVLDCISRNSLVRYAVTVDFPPYLPWKDQNFSRSS